MDDSFKLGQPENTRAAATAKLIDSISWKILVGAILLTLLQLLGIKVFPDLGSIFIRLSISSFMGGIGVFLLLNIISTHMEKNIGVISGVFVIKKGVLALGAIFIGLLWPMNVVKLPNEIKKRAQYRQFWADCLNKADNEGLLSKKDLSDTTPPGFFKNEDNILQSYSVAVTNSKTLKKTYLECYAACLDPECMVTFAFREKQRVASSKTMEDENPVSIGQAGSDQNNLSNGSGGESSSISGDNQKLIYLLTRGEPKSLKLLLESGLDPNTVVTNGQSLIFLAIATRSLEKATLLLEKGANLEHTEKFGLTPLFAAVAIGEFQMVKLLVAHGADVNAKGHNGQGLLHFANNGLKTDSDPKDRLEIIKFLKSKGVKE